jgi:pimeloyl-ACP methyl ester carboxylesterase/class 3 adenylate cyclase
VLRPPVAGRILRLVEVPRTRYAVASEGVRVAYQVIGGGPLDLVCLPSAGSHVEIFWEEPSVARYLRRLASFSRLILFDKRGAGMSDRIEGVPTLEQRMDDLRAVMDAADSSRAALLGMSEGAAMAAMFAATYPERVTSLVLMGAAIRCWLPSDLDVDDPAIVAYVDEHLGDGFSIEQGAPSVAHDDRIRAWVGRVERFGSTPTSFRAMMKMNQSLDAEAILPAVSVPTLVIHRSGDQIVVVDQGREAAQLIPGARYVELPGSDHFPYFDDPDTTLALIEEFVTGQRHVPEPDRVLATVMFTDIVDSTGHTSRLGDRRWKDLLTDYDAMVDRHLGEFRGQLVKTTGDGTVATFDGPGRAVRCATAIRDGAQQLGIQVRTGLHTGEIELRPDDITGLAVVIAQRISATAHANEILVSSTVRDLTVGSTIGYEVHGERALKGVPDAWTLFTAHA